MIFGGLRKMKMNFKKVLTITIAAILICIYSFIVIAESDPWQNYKEYIPDEMPVVQREFRAAWIATVGGLDWPLPETILIEDNEERITKSKEEMIAFLDKAVEMNLNAILFQVSPTADSFYKSDMIPWSRYLTGTFGKDPEFDPLEFVIEEAHKRNLELHAWFNPYRISTDISAETIDSLNVEKSVYMEHLDWVRIAGGRFVLDPGIPEAREWVIERVLEVVKNYDIDGVHFDDYFYTESVFGEMKDNDTYLKYNNGEFNDISDWRRNNTYLLIKDLHDAISNEKKWVKFGISPIAIWETVENGFPEGIEATTSYTSFSGMYADTKKWVEEEIIDYIVPQIYFSFAYARAPYGVLAEWWADICKDKNVHLYIGQALFKVNSSSDEYFGGDKALQEFSSQMKFNTLREGIDGSIIFRISNFNGEATERVVDLIKNDLWNKSVIVPVMQWKGGIAPSKPSKGLIEKARNSVKVSWSDHDKSTAYYAIYRSIEGLEELVGKVRKIEDGRQEYLDNLIAGPGIVYYVTALDRLHNESKRLEINIEQSRYFFDVGKTQSWAVYSIDYLHKKGILFGDGNGMFYPLNNMRRADFILMLVRAFDLQAEILDNFIDVSEDMYFFNAVAIAKSLGIINGNEDKFFPKEYIIREDMFVIMKNVLEYMKIILPEYDENYLTSYSDHENIDESAKEAIARLTKAGLMAGSNGKAEPKSYSSRAEIAVIIFRMISKINS